MLSFRSFVSAFVLTTSKAMEAALASLKWIYDEAVVVYYSLNLLYVAICMIAANGIFELWLDIRTRNRLLKGMRNGVPAYLKGMITEETFQRSNRYNLEVTSFGMLKSIFSLAIEIAMLYFGFINWSWSFATNLLEHTPVPVHHITVSILVIVIMSELTSITTMPFSVYSTFVIEARWNFNNTTWATFILDEAKSRIVGYALLCPLMAGALAIVSALPNNFWLPLWLVLCVIAVAIQFLVVPVFIPIFNKLSPLPEDREELQEKLDGIAESVGMKLKKIMVIDGSRRSTKGNAMLAGMFGPKRVIIYDTMLAEMDDDTIAAVIGHELGHHVHNHIPKMLVGGMIKALLMLYVANRCYLSARLYNDFGFDTRPPLIGFFVFFQLIDPINMAVDIFDNALSRHYEYQADRFTVKLGLTGLGAGLVLLSKQNLSDCDPDPLGDFVHSSHPSLAARLRELAKAGVDPALFNPGDEKKER
ncbi:Peptidase M48 [Carpediemonas membranifera]|uniref:CAAX prenyl protease n=1 Tax=Carpediemonas membranifera TaxID=201153 RepID=A0A8J6DZ30_9EUKA|nr:Peptidase M48 [Carpediemonas membranifera]|eukprot:KAG9393069.1 Peptidase M48 [Carpediemonas membranifera]